MCHTIRGLCWDSFRYLRPGECAAVLCGTQWVSLPQLLDVVEARRIGTCDVGLQPAVAAAAGLQRSCSSASFDELVGTLATEIAQRMPRHVVNLHVYDLVCAAVFLIRTVW